MKKEDFPLDIKLKVGFGKLKFGDSPEQVTALLGDPDEAEDLENEFEEETHTVLWNYWDQAISLFFEGVDKQSLASIETDNIKTTLFGKKVFDLSEKEVHDLMHENGFKEIETEVETWGEKRISFDDGQIDFYFLNNQVSIVSWGIIVNPDGEIM